LRPKAESGGGVLGEGQKVPSSPVMGPGERCELPQRGSGQSHNCPKVFQYFQHSGWVLASESMATLPQGNQELLVVRDKVVRPQVSLA